MCGVYVCVYIVCESATLTLSMCVSLGVIDT